jgi:hypothetical protein
MHHEWWGVASRFELRSTQHRTLCKKWGVTPKGERRGNLLPGRAAKKGEMLVMLFVAILPNPQHLEQ